MGGRAILWVGASVNTETTTAGWATFSSNQEVLTDGGGTGYGILQQELNE
jgi:hypothetical protein